MRIRILVLSGLLILPSAGFGSTMVASATETLRERADAQVESITDLKQYMLSIDHALELARKGEYGRLRRGSERRLQAARDRIANVLEGHTSVRELRVDDRIAIYNAQEQIQSIINNEDKDRMVCRREAGLGTRIATTVCLTVAEREARGRVASETTGQAQRGYCIQGEGNPCGN